jgi:hypothetical protein
LIRFIRTYEVNTLIGLLAAPEMECFQHRNTFYNAAHDRSAALLAHRSNVLVIVLQLSLEAAFAVHRGAKLAQGASLTIGVRLNKHGGT